MVTKRKEAADRNVSLSCQQNSKICQQSTISKLAEHINNKSQSNVTKNSHQMSPIMQSSPCQTAVKNSNCNKVMTAYSQRKSAKEYMMKDTPNIVTDASKEHQDNTSEEAIRPNRQGLLYKHLKERWNPLYLIVYLILVHSTIPVNSSRLECSSLLEESLDESDLVIKAVLAYRSSPQEDGYLATFRIQKLLYASPEGLQSKYLRLEVPTTSVIDGNCPMSTKVKPRTTYLLFVKQMREAKDGLFASHEDFSLVSAPVKVTRHILRHVRSLISQTKGEKMPQPMPSSKKVVSRYHRETATEVRRHKSHNPKNEKFTCSARGNPAPTLYWTVDGVVVKNSNQAKIINKKISKYLRKSILRIRGPLMENTYLQCHAVNTYGRDSRVKPLNHNEEEPSPEETNRQTAAVSALPTFSSIYAAMQSAAESTTQPPPQTSFYPVSSAGSGNRMSKKLQGFRSVQKMGSHHHSASKYRGLKNPMESTGCPVENYCMNGGTCQYYSNIGELTCHCSKGFQGRRCERKYVSTTGQLPSTTINF